MTTWFTSDHHFGHVNIIKHCDRPFVDIAEMEETMIERWNMRVQLYDTVWHIGDLFSFKPREMDIDHARAVLEQLNGTIHLICGNHDVQPWLMDVMHGNNSVREYQEMKVDGKRVVLCHYPIESWNGMYHGAIHLHGHSHGMLKHKIDNRVDVGVDVWDFYPVRLEDIFPVKKKAKPALNWRTSNQIRGVRAMLARDTNACADGAYVTIDLKTARNLLEVCDQAIHTEEGHGA